MLAARPGIILDKILYADPDTYVIFYVSTCPYCQGALNLLRNKRVKYKGYNINDIKGGMTELLSVLNRSDRISFNPNHQTKPIIFLNKKLIGGYDDLQNYLGTSKKY